MLCYDRIDVSGDIDVNKASQLKQCIICHYWYFLDKETNRCKQMFAVGVIMY